MPLRSFGRTAGILVVYGALFLLFDSASTFFEVAPGVSPWYPSAGLNLALLILLGPAYAPTVFAALMMSGLFIIEPPIPLKHLLLPNGILTVAYAGAAAWLRHRFTARALFSVRSVLAFVVVVAAMSAVVAPLAVGSYAWTGLYTDTDLLPAILNWWVGDVVALLTITPLFLLTATAWVPPESLSQAEQNLLQFHIEDDGGLVSFAVELGIIVGVLYLAFYWLAFDHFQYYLCFLPLIWIAVRQGLPRTLLAVAFLNAGAAIALRHRGSTGDVFEMQLFMIALALTGLFMGVLVSERQRAVNALRTAGQHLENRMYAYAATLRGPESPLAPPTLSDGWLTRSVDAVDRSQNILRRSTENLVALNEQLQRSEQRLQDVNRQKDQFLSIISHDLKNPLVGIRGLSEMLARRPDTPEDQRRPLTLMQRSAQQALDLLENLLTWARLQTGHFPHDPELHNLHALVSSAIDLLESHALKKDIALENVVDPDLMVYADDIALDTVLRNLISNAIKFTEPGGFVTLGADGADGTVTLQVSDTGVGMSEERINALFSAAHRITTGGTDGEVGTGLGLQLCRTIVAQHGGHLRAESEPGVGTTFFATLPAAPPAEDEDSPSAHDSARSMPNSMGGERPNEWEAGRAAYGSPTNGTSRPWGSVTPPRRSSESDEAPTDSDEPDRDETGGARR